MRRRHVVRFALGYAAAAFVILQLADPVFPAFGLGENALRILVIVLALGFPPAAVVAWIYDITRDGIVRTEGGTDNVVPRLALLVVTVSVVSGLGVWLAALGVFAPAESAASLADTGSTFQEPLAEYDPTVPIRSIAVLPLQDFSSDRSFQYFVAGMHEELIAKLSPLEELRVVSRTSVMQYADTRKSAPQIGRELGVDALIEGSVNRSGDQVRITLQIIHAPSDSHIQTLQFDREVGNALALQTEIAHEVAREIDSDHGEDLFERTVMNVSPAAQDLYLMGKFEYDRGTPEGYRAAFEYFSDALENDPDFAPAMAGLAGARFLVGMEDGEMDAAELELARTEAAEALAMDGQSVEAREVYSYIERSVPLVIPAPNTPPSVSASAPEGTTSVRVVMIPGTADSMRIDLSDLSDLEDAWVSARTALGQRIEEQVRRRSMRVGGSDGQQQALAARQLMGSGRFSEARGVLENVVVASPNFSPAWEMLSRAEVSEGDVSAALDVVTRWQHSGANGAPDELSVEALREAVHEDGIQGYWLWALDRLETNQRDGRDMHTELASANAGAGDLDGALEHLMMALQHGERGLLTLRWDPVWDDLRRDERFKELVQQIGAMRRSPMNGRGREGRGGPGRGNSPGR